MRMFIAGHDTRIEISYNFRGIVGMCYLGTRSWMGTRSPIEETYYNFLPIVGMSIVRHNTDGNNTYTKEVSI